MANAEDGAWGTLQGMVGKDFSPTAVMGVDRIEAGAIRRYLEPLEFDCALHHDAAFARRHGFADVTAPYTSLSTFCMPALWRPGERLWTTAGRDALPPWLADGLQRQPGLPREATQYFVTDVDTDFLRPVLAGERVGRRGRRLLSCTPKQTSVGRGAFLVFESDTIDAHGEVVARHRRGLFHYAPQPGPAGERPAASAAPAEPATPPQPPAAPPDCWEAVAAGDLLPPHSFPLTVHRLVVAAGANRDFNPLHHNSAYAQASGAPEMYANNFFLQGMWEKTVRAWIGPAGTLRALNGFRMRVFSTVGQTVVVRGRVLRTWRDGDAGCVEIALWSETAHGTTVGPGRVVATVPLRQP